MKPNFNLSGCTSLGVDPFSLSFIFRLLFTLKPTFLLLWTILLTILLVLAFLIQASILVCKILYAGFPHFLQLHFYQYMNTCILLTICKNNVVQYNMFSRFYFNLAWTNKFKVVGSHSLQPETGFGMSRITGCFKS